MGLGLTISKLILQELKGDITVQSEFGQGSTFEFHIPISEYVVDDPKTSQQSDGPHHT